MEGVVRWLEEIGHDVRFAVRQLRLGPAFTLLVTTTLAIGIGANATMAGAIDRLLLRSPPAIEDPDRVVRLLRLSPLSTTAGDHQHYPAYQDLRAANALESLAGYSSTRLSLGVGSDAIEVRVTMATPEFFQVFGARPAVGRFFSHADGYPEGEVSSGTPLAVLGYGFWQRQFAGDTGVVGRSIRVGRSFYTIVGVSPRGFRGVEIEAPDLWLPTRCGDHQLARQAALPWSGAVGTVPVLPNARRPAGRLCSRRRRRRGCCGE